jgi:PPM family protein phosphatase
MIWRSRDPRYDVASGISQGARDYQEDAITADFPVGAEAGFVVLADGMGGHAAGDVASKIILTEVYSELKFHYADVEAFERRAPEILRSVAEFANETLRDHAEQNPETRGMGATLVVPALVENRLWWISIGDSPLFLYRNGQLSQLNEDHSMGPQIDFMVQSGLLDAKIAVDHPDRNCLLSVLMGSEIAKVDCPVRPLELKAGDIVICASDGLQFLSNVQITKILTKYRKTRSTEIAERLLDEIDRLGDPDQDNISFTVIKVNNASVRPKAVRPPQSTVAVPRPRGLTTVVAEPELVAIPLPVPVPTPEPVPAPTAEVEPEPVATAAVLPMAEVVEIEAILRETAAAAETEAASLDEEEPQVIVVPRRFAALA